MWATNQGVAGAPAGYGPGQGPSAYPQNAGYGQPPDQGGQYTNAGYADENAYGGGYGGGMGGPPPGVGGMDPGAMRPPGNSMWTLVFFGCSILVMVGSGLSFFSLLSSAEFMDCIECVFLFIFGFAMAVVDNPRPRMRMGKAELELQAAVGKYFQLGARVTGRGFVFLFLGTTMFSNMWVNLESGFMTLLSLICLIGVASVGLLAIVMGWMKSRKLDNARRHLQMQPGLVDSEFQRFAQTGNPRDPRSGMTQQEFNQMTTANGTFRFDDQDLAIIFSALCSNPAWRMQAMMPMGQVYEERISLDDLRNWVNGGLVML